MTEVKPVESVDYREEYTEARNSDHTISSGSSDTDDIHGDTSEFPRLGDQYQAEIPPMLLRRPSHSSFMLDASFPFGLGSAIPITWVNLAGHEIKHEAESLGTPFVADTALSTDSVNNSKYPTIFPPVTSRIHDTVHVDTKFQVETSGKSVENCQLYATNMSQIHLSAADTDDPGGYTPLPGSLVVSWRDVEVQSFLLGLYIFGKDLGQVGKFVGTKTRGDILAFYYGNFYKSGAYRRWAESRKLKGKKYVHGQRIFAGWRKQELLSRVLPTMPIDVQERLQQAVKSFGDGRSTLEVFVFTLKNMVGLQHFVEAVGIGKGKNDLTDIALDKTRSNQVIKKGPEIPVGKACSSLTSGNIISLLNGGCRLSKAKSNDLFWEAVWPRLLARGWHSERPKGFTSKIPLVFLVPGINNFSRRKLTKGSHYFDSISDVLNKIALEPSLLELESEGVEGSGNCKNVAHKSNQKDQSGQQRHGYLLPKLPSFSSERAKFTVVDTSLFHGQVPFKVRSLQSLCVDRAHTYKPSNIASSSSEDSDVSDSDDLIDSDVSSNDKQISCSVISEYNKFGNTKKCIMNKRVQTKSVDRLVSVSKRKLATNIHDSGEHYFGVKESEHSQNIKFGVPEHIAPVCKRQRLIGSDYTGDAHPSSSSSSYQLKKADAYRASKSVEVNEVICPEVGAFRRKSKITSAKSSQCESNESNSRASSSGTGAVCKAVHSQKKPALFDLNIPQFSPDFDANEPFCMDMAGCQNESNQKDLSVSSEIKQEPDAYNSVASVEQPTNNGRRQGTRNRLPTAKALEAVASGFLVTKRKGRDTTFPVDDLVSRPSRRPCRTPGAPPHAPTSTVSTGPISSINMSAKEEYNVATDHVRNIFGKPNAWTDRFYCSELQD